MKNEFMGEVISGILKKVVIVAIVGVILGGSAFAFFTLKDKGIIFARKSKIEVEPQTIHFRSFEIDFTKVQVIEDKGREYIKISTMLNNIGDKSDQVLSFFRLTRYDLKGIQIPTSEFSRFDDDIDKLGKIRAGATMDTYIYVPYTGDGDYYLEFLSLSIFSSEQMIEVKVSVKK